MMASTDTDPGRTVLVTGGTGHLGSWVVARLLARGYRVRATVRGLDRAGAPCGAVARQAPVDAFTVVAADLLAGDCWDEAMRGVDDVIHVASPLPGDSAQDIVSTARTGAHHVIAAAGRAGVGRIVMTSSLAAAATGHGGELIDENTWSSPADSPGDAYARSKTLAERPVQPGYGLHCRQPQIPAPSRWLQGRTTAGLAYPPRRADGSGCREQRPGRPPVRRPSWARRPPRTHCRRRSRPASR